MNDKERKEIRYQNRKLGRLENQKKFQTSLPSYEKVFSYENLIDAFYKCRSGVRWKESVQRYESNLSLNTYRLHRDLMNLTYKSKGFMEFDINERGKIRHIKSVHISERCVQKALCDNYLVPLLERNLIYDNGATLKGKGIDFSINRLKYHLQKFYKENNTNRGIILTFDFTDYFNSINHELLFNYLISLIDDDKIYNLVTDLISNFGIEGLGLGSQISQICAVSFPNKLDHYIKDILGCKYYGRYMDDGYIICKNRYEAKEYIDVIYNICHELGIIINEDKIKINRIDKKFKYLKKYFTLTYSGKVIISLCNESIVRERRRLKKFKNKLDTGTMSYEDIKNSYKSWRGWAIGYNNYNSIKNMDKLFHNLFNKHIC